MNSTIRLRQLAACGAAVAIIAGLTACATPSGEPAPDAAAPAPPVSGPASAPAPTPAQSAQRLVISAAEFLEAGQEDLGLAEVQRALQADPGNPTAQNLLRQIQSDPVDLLGGEFFLYRVEPGETLSRIAGRFLKDRRLFYALARYNDIKVPRMLQGGQTIKVPGRQPAPPAPPLPPPAVTRAAPPTPEPAPVATPPEPPPAAASAPPPPSAPEPDVTQEYRHGLLLMAQQKPAEAVQAFDQVLQRAPEHANAKLKRAQAMNQVSGLIRLLDNKLNRVDGQLAKDPKNAALRAERDKTAADRERLAAIK
jgi:hypothetical protein